MINIYPSNIEGQPIETYRIEQPETIEGWLIRNVPSYEVREQPPISITLNGTLIPPSEWASTVFRPKDTLDICPDPHGLDPFSWALIIAVVVSVAISITSMLMAGNVPKPSQTKKGNKLDESTAKGNRVKLNDIIREVAGTFKVYPDYLLPPHRYFVDGVESWSEMLLCIGKGQFNIPPETILIGDTRMDSLELNADYTIYQPGADLSAVSAARWFHSAPEVGGTSTGKSGLELNATYVLGEISSASAYTFNGDVITIPEGAGEFPDWPVNFIITIEHFLDYTVIEGWSDRDIISGDLSGLAPFAGMVIEITGENEGNYVVNSVETDSDGIWYMTLNYPSGTQVNGLLTGIRRMSIGYKDQKYKITYIKSEYGIPRDEIHVDRFTDEGVIDAGWAGFTFAITNDAIIAIDASDQEGEWAGPFAACPSGEVTDTIEYDVMFPGGITKISTKGNLLPITVKTELQWRPVSGGEWVSVVKEFAGATLDQLGYTETIALGGMYRPEVRMRRIGTKSTLTSVQDTVEWYGLKSKLLPPTSYAGVTTMAVKIRGGDKLSAQTDSQVSTIVTRLLPTRSAGEWTEPAATRSIIPWVAYVAKSMGYTDEDLDLVSMDELDTLWNSRGDYYDFSVEDSGTVKGEILSALRAGFADITLNRGAIKPVRDQVRTVYEHMYTPQNMTEQLSRSFTTRQPDDVDGVDVEYINSTTWAKETVECRLPSDAGVKVEKITLEGVTDRTRAWRIGMRQRRMHRYRRWSYEWSTELDALNSHYLSFCAVGDDVPGYSQSAILLDLTDTGTEILLKSSEPFTWVDGQTHVVGIRRQDGTLSGPYTATRVSDYILSVESIDFEPDTTWTVEPPHLIFGTVNRWSYPVLVTSISHGGDNKVSVEASNYDVRCYSDDDNTP